VNTVVTREFLAFYDRMLGDYQRMNRENFRQHLMRSCAEFAAEFPGNSEALVAMQLHFERKGKDPPAV